MKKTAALLLVTLAGAGTLVAAPASAVVPGRLVLTTGPGVSSLYLYDDCTRPRQNAAPSGLAAFANTPAPGCAASLSNGAQWLTLCSGHGIVPEAYRTGAMVHIHPGTSVPCPGP